MNIKSDSRPYTDAITRLRGAGLRPTRQRLALAKLLSDGGHRHLTAEGLHEEARDAGLSISLATVYNTLHQFTKAGFVREIVVDSGRAWFDTNTSDHHHIYFEDDNRLVDVPDSEIDIAGIPEVAGDQLIDRVELVVRVRNR